MFGISPVIILSNLQSYRNQEVILHRGLISKILWRIAFFDKLRHLISDAIIDFVGSEAIVRQMAFRNLQMN